MGASSQMMAQLTCIFDGSTPGDTDCSFTGINGAILTVTAPNLGCSSCFAHINAVFNAVGTSCCARLVKNCGGSDSTLVACAQSWTFNSDVTCSCVNEPWSVRIEACHSGCGCQGGQDALARMIDCNWCV